MRILVAGGAGFIGGALVPKLVALGHEVSATIYSREPQPKILGVKYTEADLTTRMCWNTALDCSKPEVVCMMAGKTGGSGVDPLHFVTDNALIALQMYRSCQEHGVRKIVAMSSTTGYPNSGKPMKEEDYFSGELHPAYFNPGHTRRFIERLAAMYPSIETVFLRCAGVYGPGDDFDAHSSHVIAATIRKVAERHDPLHVWGDGEAVRDAIYIDDLADAIVKSLDWPGGAYNLGFGFGMSVNRMLEVLLQHAKHNPLIVHDNNKPSMIPVRLLDCNKAWKAGWVARIPLSEGLCRTLDWYERS